MIVSLPKQKEQIDDETYEMTMLDGLVASELYAKILNSIGGSLSSVSALSVQGDIESDTGAQMDLALRALGAIMQGLKPALLVEVRDLFAKNCTVEKDVRSPKVKDVFAIHFAGRMAHMSKWMFACMRFNFADFLDESLVKNLVTKYQGLTQSTNRSPQESTGSSNEYSQTSDVA